MRANRFLGGMVRRASAERLPSGLGRESLSWESRLSPAGWTLFARAEGEFVRSLTENGVTLLLRGCALMPERPEPAAVLPLVHEHYCRFEDLPTDRLEGAFSLAVIDRPAGRIVLYQNLAGSGFIYYTDTFDGFLFASCLPLLLDLRDVAPQVHEAMLPAYFAFRTVPGRHTLFAAIDRLLPGELLRYDDRGLHRQQRDTVRPWREAPTIGAEAVEHLEETMTEVLAHYAGERPATATLLSGGVDSSYLQAVWSQTMRRSDQPPRSFAVRLDHPRTRADADYAQTTAAALRTEHTFVDAEAPFSTYLLETLAETGEPLNHLQAGYFLLLARTMVADGYSSGLCGEGADALFGHAEAGPVHTAEWLRRLLPAKRLRDAAHQVAEGLGWERLACRLRLAQRLYDLDDFNHPANQITLWTHWPSVWRCFGAAAAEKAVALRREWVLSLEVASEPLELLHMVAFWADAVGSAALWTTIFNRAGGDLLCPFLDSRILRLVTRLAPRLRYVRRQPKVLLKRALSRHLPRQLVYRPKLAFSQPVFEWLAPGGQLRPLVEAIEPYPFVPREVLAEAKARPNWFLYSLLCYDLWHKTFICQTLPREKEDFSRWDELPTSGTAASSRAQPRSFLS
ncbi:MAG: asparagine synthase-related protein [Gemmataceae bacterium]|nr:asparagine synthase-related protein [Gemmataceae bacterium]MDW8265900.1 asparagine synthase-related protein [Gemmataceae bacterium]